MCQLPLVSNAQSLYHLPKPDNPASNPRMQPHTQQTPWASAILPIASIFSFRMLGLFMLIPVFTVYAGQLRGNTPFLAGLALGAYGLAQGLLQMPFGILSDYFGRKPLLTIGLILFALGSLIGVFSDSIYGVLLARILQGTGAIGSVLTALLADLTPASERTKAMAVIGITIGVSFSLAMVTSPAIAQYSGLSGIFATTFGLAVCGLLMLHLVVPTPPPIPKNSAPFTALLAEVVRIPALQRLNAGIFIQHLILTSTFYVIPMLLKHAETANAAGASWRIYLPLVTGSFLAMLPLIYLAERKGYMRKVFPGCVLTTALCQIGMALTSTFGLPLITALFVYFICFNFLEASLPSLISREAETRVRGSAMGVYSSCQFLGIFAGGTLAGMVYGYFGTHGIFIMNGIFGLLWAVIARKAGTPQVVLDRKIGL
ncbi:transporter, major facilitator family [Legionella geestiana]|uniref:Transporter, major facilitator family n=2 Tax=Legionella geestiana TaxID=45065 RepID=A0A0W0U8J3_9GAMM|nr:MFS transporter [Legionella geestiana]KTD04106.1 transporter, major facilitator family [Legionella geestiana]STX53159.1 transporter, major facilitator family [Legionella geestiana]